jgi:hypothetical protein
MQQTNENKKVKDPDKQVTGQQHSGNNDGAPIHPMKQNSGNKDQQQKNKINPANAEEMGSGKRQDDN